METSNGMIHTKLASNVLVNFIFSTSHFCLELKLRTALKIILVAMEDLVGQLKQFIYNKNLPPSNVLLL